ncbi:MAG: hypothetical protein IT299_05810 [Dehalococcoidia bacterium]|nr:hypothetical protein [Dehalococcoidia bacterium]
MKEQQGSEPIALEAVRARRTKCVHHWVLQEPSEGWVRGKCKNCNARRKYPAAPESTQRFDDYRELVAPSAYVERLAA